MTLLVMAGTFIAIDSSAQAALLAIGIFIMAFFPVLYFVRRDPELRLALPIPLGMGLIIIISVLVGGLESPYFGIQVAATLVVGLSVGVYSIWLLRQLLHGVF